MQEVMVQPWKKYKLLGNIYKNSGRKTLGLRKLNLRQADRDEAETER